MKKSIFKLISYAVIFLSLVFSVSAAALTIPEARTSPAGSEVTVNGYAFSATDTPSTGFINEFYLNDAKAQGICVVPSTGTSVTLLSGYSVTGTLSEENGELKIINATVTALNNTLESAASNVVTVTTLKVEGIVENTIAFSIYPNPVNDKINIETEVEVEEVVVYTITGVVVGQQTTVNGQQTSSIDVSNLNSGIYFVKVVTENREVVKRFVKK